MVNLSNPAQPALAARVPNAHEHKVGGLLWLEAPDKGHWLLSQDTNGLVRLWSLAVKAEDGTMALEPLCSILATPPAGKSGPLTFAQSASTLPPCGGYGGALVLGDRAGRMSAYVWPAGERCPADGAQPAVRIQVHGDDTVTSLSRAAAAQWTVRSVGRDGHLVETELSAEGTGADAPLKLTILRRRRVRRRVDWLAHYWSEGGGGGGVGDASGGGGDESGSEPRDLVLAFSKKDMLVLDLRQDEEVRGVPRRAATGGGVWSAVSRSLASLPLSPVAGPARRHGRRSSLHGCHLWRGGCA